MDNRFKFRFWHKPTEKMVKCYGYNRDFVFGDVLDGIGTTYNPAKFDDCILMQCTGLKDKNGNLIFAGDIVTYYHNKKKLVPVTDRKPFEAPYGNDKETGLPLQYRAVKVIRYKGYVSIDAIGGMELNLRRNLHWWKSLEKDILTQVEVIGNIYENKELLESEA